MAKDKKEPETSLDDFPERPGTEVPGLVDYAKGELGAVEELPPERIAESELRNTTAIDDDTKKLFEDSPTTTDIIGSGKIVFHKDLPQVKFDDLVGHEFIIHDIHLQEGWDGFFGTSNFALLMIRLRDGSKATTLAGGVAIFKQARLMREKMARRLNYSIKVKLTTRPGAQGPYKIFE